MLSPLWQEWARQREEERVARKARIASREERRKAWREARRAARREARRAARREGKAVKREGGPPAGKIKPRRQKLVAEEVLESNGEPDHLERCALRL